MVSMVEELILLVVEVELTQLEDVQVNQQAELVEQVKQILLQDLL
tara:strand:- start:130 stop:264 length:135 start_codon:yes stop_codon:yes gene_type:complete